MRGRVRENAVASARAFSIAAFARAFGIAAFAGALAIAALALAIAVSVAHGETLEPPPEAPDGEDYAIDTADSLDQDRVEVSLGASGRSGVAPRRTRRVRFSGDSLEATVREGDDDPLSGGTLAGRGGRATYGVGKLSPRWGRGLVFGSPAEPWSAIAGDRGARAAFRGRSGEGAWIERGRAWRVQALHGRFSKRRLTALSLRGGGATVGAAFDEFSRGQASLGFEHRGAEGEWAFDRAGRWRAEGVLSKSDGDLAWTGRVRAGHQRFQSLAEPRRSGPSEALAIGVARGPTAARVAAHGALWRFRPGVTGARAALELALATETHGDLDVGLEEQHGVRRDPDAGRVPRGGLRQGWWCEWRGGGPGVRLALRHESWGASSWARDPVRVVTAARVEAAAPYGASIRVTHTVYQARRGENLYLPEAESDRLVLRALSGAGLRTRVELAVRAAGGSLRGGVQLAAREGVVAAPGWTVEWTRRSKFQRAR